MTQANEKNVKKELEREDKTLKRFFVVLFIAFALLFLPYYIFNLYSTSLVETVRFTLNKNIDFLARAISVSYFQWDDMLEAVSNNDVRWLSESIQDLLKSFPEVENVKIENKNFNGDSLFHITSDETQIICEFGIFDNFRTSKLDGKVAIAFIPAQRLLDNMHIKNILITKKGPPLLYNLRYKSKLTLMDIWIWISISLLTLFSALITFYHYEQKNIKVIKIQEKSLRALTELTQQLLKGVLEPTYQNLLEKAIEIIPGAQAGSILTKQGDYFVYSASVGFDFEKLSNVKLKPEELVQGFTKEIQIIKNLDKFDINTLTDENAEILKTVGKIFEIKSTLSIPIVINDEILAFLNLDNFTSENAFSELSINIGRLFANQVGIIFERILLERQLREQRKQLEHLSLHDPLTGLPNRRFLEVEAKRMFSLALRENKKVCLFFLDLKNFKPINDYYGHDIGDYVIKVVAQRLKNTIRQSDFISRVGGDEFVILMYDCKGYEEFINRISQEIQKDIFYNYVKIIVAGNFGVAVFPEDAQNFDELLKKADKAMYYAKKNDLLYYPASQL
jgi:diguanylate cyclase (GGDEF)-like protein